MDAATALHLDQQLCFALYATSRAMTQAYAPVLAPLGVTYPQYLVLLALWEADGVAVKDLGRRLHLDSGTLTPLLKRLSALGLVTRQRDAADERVVRIHLTAAGRGLKRKAAAVPREMLCRIDLTLPELGRLRRQLTDLGDRLRGATTDQETPP